MIKVQLTTITGRMSNKIQSCINEDDRFTFKNIKKQTKISDNWQDIDQADIVIDFSHPSITSSLVKHALQVKEFPPLLIGTTDLSHNLLRNIEKLAHYCPILLTANTSIGIELTKQLSIFLASRLGNTYDIEITDSHHRNKIDAPSGTAIAIGESIAQTKKTNFSEMAVFNRHSARSPRKANQIGFSSLRAGNITGEHNVHFISNDEEIIITHKAHSLHLFAKGALEGAYWLIQQKPGLYNMTHVFN